MAIKNKKIISNTKTIILITLFILIFSSFVFASINNDFAKRDDVGFASFNSRIVNLRTFHELNEMNKDDASIAFTRSKSIQRNIDKISGIEREHDYKSEEITQHNILNKKKLKLHQI